MDETDIFFLGSKKSKSKHDKADANYIPENQPSASNAEKKVITSIPTDEDTYKNDYPKTGIALIFNHENVKGQKPRVGTEKDRDSMEKSLSQYGFDVRTYNELSFQDITETLKATANEDHSANDCFVLVVMSHGAEGKVYARDMSYPVDRLWKPFLGENCKTLINKPKLFFIQACRGENLDKPVEYVGTFTVMSRELVPQKVKPPTITYAIPNTADMLVMYSTFDKHFSFRNVENGSWFIQSLCRVLDEGAMNPESEKSGLEIYSLLTAVNRKVAYEYQSLNSNDAFNQMKEMPNFLSTLTKMFYLKVKKKEN